MTLLTFTYAADDNEVFIGTVEDIIAHGLQPGSQTFHTEEDLFVALQPVREQEKIVTCVSDLDVLQTMWAQKWDQAEPTVAAIQTATKTV